MKINKQAGVDQALVLDETELGLINAMSKKTLTAEEVYVFAVRLCDNQVDRDGERFPVETLEELAGLFVGKSGIFDHQWSARGQTARIYRTELVRDETILTEAGEPLCYLKGCAYMLRTQSNQDLIAEIEGGIKKEVSVGCAVERAVCSVCGQPWGEEGCDHRKGERYDGRLCYAALEGAKDAYEFSFVAVPAQPLAGVVKSAGGWRELAAQVPGGARELEELEKEAQLGRQYLERLRGELVRQAVLADGQLEEAVIRSAAGKLSHRELEALTASFARRAGERYPLKTQLRYGEQAAQPREGDRAFLV